MEDALFIEQGVNNDELEEAIMYYIGSDDEQIKNAMKGYM